MAQGLARRVAARGRIAGAAILAGSADTGGPEEQRIPGIVTAAWIRGIADAGAPLALELIRAAGTPLRAQREPVLATLSDHGRTRPGGPGRRGGSDPGWRTVQGGD